MVNGWQNAQRLMRPDVFEGFLGALAQDRAQRYTGGESAKIPVVAPEGEPSALPTPESHEWFTHAGNTVAPNWRNELSLESMETFLEYGPVGNIHLVSPPAPDNRCREGHPDADGHGDRGLRAGFVA